MAVAADDDEVRVVTRVVVQRTGRPAVEDAALRDPARLADALQVLVRLAAHGGIEGLGRLERSEGVVVVLVVEN